ncbi:hypothetical protein [Planomonospora sp. ID82291]|uniref:hypothetical protein n=1 Tax=Planomonospora sp. ID82291 TaxID=2738136 RepID=UPI0027DAB5ED|nr:hypothetical protein [Planomonospora sp. ID82291]
MTTVRSLVTAAVIAPIVSVPAMLATAGPAHAKASLDMPSRVTSDRKVTISGRVDLVFDAVLHINGRQVAKGDRRVSYVWDPRTHPNGRYTVRLVERGKLLGGKWDETSRMLVQSVPPAVPGGVGVRLRGDRVALTWSRGAEPDLRGYEIFTSRTGRVGTVDVSRACGGGSCRATLVLPAKAAGRRIGFTVRAIRGDGRGGTLVSGRSAVAAVNVSVPAAPERPRSAGDDEDRRDAGVRRDEPNSGGRERRSGVESLPRLPQADAATSRARSPETAPGEASRPQKTAGSRAGTDAGAAGSRTGDSGTGDSGTGGEETGTSGSGSEAAETAPVGSAATGRRPGSATGGMSGLGLLVAGGMVLLLLGAHGGAWVRRRWLTRPAEGRATGGSGAKGNPSAGGEPPSAGPRRPAVILAVVRMPYSRRPAGDPAGVRSVPRSFAGGDGKAPGAASPGEAGSTGARSVVRAAGHAVAPEVAPEAASEPGRTGHADRPEESGAVGEVPPAHPAVTGSALPAAAPAPEIGSVTPVAVRSGGGRWDGYLPSAPRSIEDSGFWERPQPGATDFWAEDREEDERDPGVSGGFRSGRFRSGPLRSGGGAQP